MLHFTTKIIFASILWQKLYSRNRSALAVNCCVIIHCLEASCKEDQITCAQLELIYFLNITFNLYPLKLIYYKNNENTFEVFSFFQLSAIALKNPRQYFDYVAFLYVYL